MYLTWSADIIALQTNPSLVHDVCAGLLCFLHLHQYSYIFLWYWCGIGCIDYILTSQFGPLGFRLCRSCLFCNQMLCFACALVCTTLILPSRDAHFSLWVLTAIAQPLIILLVVNPLYILDTIPYKNTRHHYDTPSACNCSPYWHSRVALVCIFGWQVAMRNYTPCQIIWGW